MTLALLLVDLEQRGSAETLQNPVLNTSTGVHPCVKFGGACGLAPGELVLWRSKRGRRWVLKSSRDPTCFFLLSFVCLCESVCVTRPHCDFQASLTLFNISRQFIFLYNGGGPLEMHFLTAFPCYQRGLASVFWTCREHCLSNSLVFINSHSLYSADTNLILYIAHADKYLLDIWMKSNVTVLLFFSADVDEMLLIIKNVILVDLVPSYDISFLMWSDLTEEATTHPQILQTQICQLIPK